MSGWMDGVEDGVTEMLPLFHRTKCKFIFLFSNKFTQAYIENATEWCLSQDQRATMLTIRNGFENAEIAGKEIAS